MDQAIEFVGNHWWLVAIWAAFFVALLWDNKQRAGASVSPAQAIQMINKDDALVLDIRDKKDFGKGHVVNAKNIPFANLAGRLGELDTYKSRPVLLVCKTGTTVSVASKMLKEKGFNAIRMTGGMMEWEAQKLPVVRK